MEKSSKRGKIPQHDWPSIISRYESGETLASIARTYDCSPPAISYIVSRSRARGMAGEESTPKTGVVPAANSQLVKAADLPGATNDISDGELMHSNDSWEGSRPSATRAVQSGNSEQPADMPDPSQGGGAVDQSSPPRFDKAQDIAKSDGTSQRVDDGPRDSRLAEVRTEAGNGSPRPPSANGGSPPPSETRRTLHLSLPQGNGSAGPNPAPHPAPQNTGNSGLATDARLVSRQEQPGFASQPRQPSGQAPHFGPPRGQPGGLRDPAETLNSSYRARESGAFIDHTLRERINDDIAAFLAAFDAALDHDTIESRIGLREATDRLLRAGARTRIELERLEARVPLPPRESGQRPSPTSRSR